MMSSFKLSSDSVVKIYNSVIVGCDLFILSFLLCMCCLLLVGHCSDHTCGPLAYIHKNVFLHLMFCE
jgi:hypothetical protein